MKNILRKYRKIYEFIFQLSTLCTLMFLLVQPMVLKGMFVTLDSIQMPVGLISLTISTICIIVPFFVFRKERLESGRKF